MKVRKLLIAILSIAVFAGLWLTSSDFHLTYMLAGIVYGNAAPADGKIIFSRQNGFYEKEFYLSIFAPSDEVFYTLDGSDPTRESFKYESPILIKDASQNENVYSMRTDVSGGFQIAEPFYKVPDYLVDKCTILKVAYYDDEGNRSKVEERVYFVSFGEKTGYENINIISVTTDPDNLFGEEEGIYVLGDTYEEFCQSNNPEDFKWYRLGANFLNRGKDWEREAHIQVFNENKQPVLSQSVGIRIQGGVSRGFNPKSLNFYARDEYGDNRMRYDFFDTGYYPQRLTLSGGGNDYYGKMLDRLGAELTESCDFCTMHYEPYVLFLNGEYWGFYYLTEKYDEHYIEQYYDVAKENVIIVKNHNIEAGTAEDQELYQQMKDFMEYADMTIDENYHMACSMIDMQSFIDYFAAEVYMARQVDWPMANFALWRSREASDKPYEDGKWRWMLFDVNTAALLDAYVDHDTLAFVMEESPMFANLCNNANFRACFEARLREMSDTIFAENMIDQKVTEYEELMSEPMEKNHQRFFGESNASLHGRTSSIREFAHFRKEYVEIMLEENFGQY